MENPNQNSDDQKENFNLDAFVDDFQKVEEDKKPAFVKKSFGNFHSTLFLPKSGQNIVGHIIGKKWANAKLIQEKTKTRLEFPKGSNLVKISGLTQQGIKEAEKLINATIQKALKLDLPKELRGFDKQKWLVASKFGKSIKCDENVGIVPFKCPLNEIYKQLYSDEEMLYPKDVVEHYKNESCPLGAVIDLTDTAKYYKPEEWGEDVDYNKMKIPGQAIPSEQIVTEVIGKIDELVRELSKQEKPVSLGIHCTHGINRTGFFVITYLIEFQKMTLDDAINTFNEARKPSIFKKEIFVEELQRKYGSSKSAQIPNDEISEMAQKLDEIKM